MRRVLLALASGVAVAALAGCSLPASSGQFGASGPVRFEVTGTGTANNITWGVNGNQSQQTKARLPFAKDVATSDSFVVSSLVAQNGGSGSITCKISRDGETIAQQTSEGEYAVVTCSG